MIRTKKEIEAEVEASRTGDGYIRFTAQSKNNNRIMPEVQISILEYSKKEVNIYEMDC